MRMASYLTSSQLIGAHCDTVNRNNTTLYVTFIIVPLYWRQTINRTRLG